MKRIFNLIAIAILLSSFTFASNTKMPVAQGNTNSQLGTYLVENAGMFEMIKGEPLKAYTIWYENSPDSLTVAVESCGNGTTRFLVISEDLVIEYICYSNYFGARLIDDRFEEEGFSTSIDNLNRQEYYHQKLITPKGMTETEYLGLIAVYFPRLIKDHSNIFAKQE